MPTISIQDLIAQKGINPISRLFITDIDEDRLYLIVAYREIRADDLFLMLDGDRVVIHRAEFDYPDDQGSFILEEVPGFRTCWYGGQAPVLAL